MTNPYVPMADAAPMAGGLAATDGKVVSSTDPQFSTTQYNPNDYMNNDQYNQYYSTQYNRGGDAYQTTTEFNTNEYAYDQEQVRCRFKFKILRCCSLTLLDSSKLH